MIEEVDGGVVGGQTSFFDDREHSVWAAEWQSMPEFIQRELTPAKSVLVHFASFQDMASFARLVNQRVTDRTQSIWYPEAEIGRFADKRYADEP